MVMCVKHGGNQGAAPVAAASIAAAAHQKQWNAGLAGERESLLQLGIVILCSWEGSSRAVDGGDAAPELPVLVQVPRHELQEELRRGAHVGRIATAARCHLEECRQRRPRVQSCHAGVSFVELFA